MKYFLDHVSISTSDGLDLPGLLYEPSQPTHKVAIYLHGNGGSSIFYKPGENKIIAEGLIKKNIAYFPFNNRGAGFIQKFKRIINGEKIRKTYGMAYELIKECVIDIDAAVEFLENKGYKEFYLIGASTGANKVVVYDYYKKNNVFSKYILLAGGDDTGIYYDMLGKNKFITALELCKQRINDGKGRQLAPRYLVGDSLISYHSLYDTINPDGDYNIFPYNEYINKLNFSKKELFKEYRSIDKPTFVVYGELDEYCSGAENAIHTLKKESNNKNNFEYKIIPEADHGFTNKEKDLAKIITEWL